MYSIYLTAIICGLLLCTTLAIGSPHQQESPILLQNYGLGLLTLNKGGGVEDNGATAPDGAIGSGAANISLVYSSQELGERSMKMTGSRTRPDGREQGEGSKGNQELQIGW
jgi:hypothetical protein